MEENDSRKEKAKQRELSKEMSAHLVRPTFEATTKSSWQPTSRRRASQKARKKKSAFAIKPRAAEAPLTLSEESFYSLFENTVVATGQLGNDMRFLWANDRFCKMTGYSLEELRKMTPLDIGHPEEREEENQRLQRLVEDATWVYDVEKRYVRKDGQVIWVHARDIKVRDNMDRPLYSAVIIEDITAKKEIEYQNAQQQLVLEGINRILSCGFESLTEEEIGQVCLTVATEVTESKFGFINRLNTVDQVEHIAISNTGWAACNMENKPKQYNLPKAFKIHDIYRSVILDGKPLLINDVQAHPNSMGTPNGHPLIRAFLGIPLLEKGRTIGMVAVANREGGYRDADLAVLEALSESMVQVLLRWRAERELIKNYEAMRLLHSVSMQPSEDIDSFLHAVLDAAIGITDADKGSMQLYDASEDRLRLVAHRGHDQPFIDYFTTHSAQGICGEAFRKRKRVFVEDITKSDVYRDCAKETVLEAGICSAQSTPIIGSSGKLLGTFSTQWCTPHRPNERVLHLVDVLARQVADLIERKMWEERLGAAYKELKVASKHKDEFIGLLSHEIRNPLATISMCLSLLDQDDQDSEQSRKYREIMGRQVGQLAKLTDDLLDVTRFTQNKIKLQKEQVELCELVSRTVYDHQMIFREKGVELVAHLALTPVYVTADPVRLSQILGNLLHNAAKFTGRGGKTQVRVIKDMDQQCALIRVKDSGVGMSSEAARVVFKPFMVATSHIDYSSDGLGIGLVLVKGLAELHGGKVCVHSDGLGKGTEFTVQLPLASKVLPAEISVSNYSAPYRKRRVLLIEDKMDVAETLRDFLEAEGHEVMVAHDGLEGISKAKESRPEILLCDIGLPGLNGYQVAEAFCADKELKDVILVSLTGYGRPEDIRQAKEAGFQYQLTKPVDSTTLRQTLAMAE